MYTKLKKIITEEDLRRKDICLRSDEIELDKMKPGVNAATFSNICNGVKQNPTRSTMLKIVEAINSLIKERDGIDEDKYCLTDMFELEDK